MQGLSLVMEDSVYPGRAVNPIHKLLSRAPLQAQAAYSKLTHPFSLHPLLAWLRKALVLNPFGISACLRSGKSLVLAQQGRLLPPKVNLYMDHSFRFRCYSQRRRVSMSIEVSELSCDCFIAHLFCGRSRELSGLKHGCVSVTDHMSVLLSSSGGRYEES